MHYWNKDNFEGLKSVGEKYSSIRGYELFGQYCLQKEMGLKKQAITSIKEFVSVTRIRTVDEQRSVAEELSSLGFWNGKIHQLLSHPLLEYLRQVLEQWATDEPDNSTPHKWLGYVGGNISSYEIALQLDPKDEICIYRIAQAYLNDIDYQTHHLSESLFLGDFDEAKISLQSAQPLIERLSSEPIKSEMQAELNYYTKLLNCWEEYLALGAEEPFPRWCSSKGEKFNFWSVVYYDK